MAKKILVIDDSALMRRILCDIIDSDDRFKVVATANDGLEALKIIESQSFDAIVLDINMPNMNGIEFLQALIEKGLKENVLVSSTYTRDGASITITCLELGAVDFIQKPHITRDVKGDDFKDRFLELLATTANIKKSLYPAKENISKQTPPVAEKSTAGSNKIVAICSSTGGPQALKEVIPYLPKEIDAPIVLVQHMPSSFTKSLAERLNAMSQVTVSEAVDGEVLEKGHVYIAKGGAHLKYENGPGLGRLIYTDEPAREGVKPCANYLYESLSDSRFNEIICVVLTGMGKDGTAGIVNLSKSKKLYVIAQDEASSTVYGMPKAIVASGLTDKVVDLSLVAKEIIMNVGVN